MEGKTYLVKLFMFDQDHNQIILGKNVEFAHVIDPKFIKLIEKNLIGSELILQAVKHDHGHAPVTAHKTIFSASLKEIKTTQTEKYKVDSNKLKDEKEITITSPIKVLHPTTSILLPEVKG